MSQYRVFLLLRNIRHNVRVRFLFRARVTIEYTVRVIKKETLITTTTRLRQLISIIQFIARITTQRRRRNKSVKKPTPPSRIRKNIFRRRVVRSKTILIYLRPHETEVERERTKTRNEPRTSERKPI